MMYKIMLVDDEENILQALRRLLSREDDMEVKVYTDANEALRHAQAMNFDLFLSDYRMPEMNGVEFLKQVKEAQPDSMRLILSGYADFESIQSAINEAEIYRFISKPWHDSELVATLRQAMVYRNLLVENRRFADIVRQQHAELGRRKNALEMLQHAHPELAKVNWAEDGAILLEELDT